MLLTNISEENCIVYELTSLFWYKLIFMTELLLAEALFCVKLRRRSGFIFRLAVGIILCYAVAFVFPIPFYNAYWCSFLFISLFCVTLFVIWECFEETIVTAVFCAIVGYTVQHTAITLYDLVVNALNLGGSSVGFYGNSTGGIYAPFLTPQTELAYLFIFIIIYWVAYMLFSDKVKQGGELQLPNIFILIFVSLILLVDVFLSAFVTYYDGNDRFYLAIINVFNIVCCVLVLFLQFIVPNQERLKNEVKILSHLKEQERKQYVLTKENIELINLKCHDLKYQLRTIGNANAIDNSVLEEMEKVVSIYDSVVSTGNETLDILLTEKSLSCNNKGVKFTCIADGKVLEFMKAADIYSLFGNLIDNAIEAVSHLESEKKVIGVQVRQINDFVSISTYNFYKGKIVFVDGLPKTSKKDSAYHGFGMKSVRAVCQKYDGTLKIDAQDGVFSITMLFPLS